MQEDQGLERRLSGFDAATVVVSDMIGSGIFFTTGIAAIFVTSAPGLLWAWVAGGVFALLGALSYAELAAMLPRAGGEYNYLREAYGDLPAFLSGWTSLFVGFSAPIAIGALAFTKYGGGFIPFMSAKNVLFSLGKFNFTGGTLVALLLIASLAAFHFLGRGTDKRAQVFLTILKVAALVALILAALVFGKGSISNLTSQASNYTFSLTAFAAAVVPITFSYSGWNASAYLAGEIKNPARNLPLSLLGGTLVVTLVYICINVVYLTALPVTDFKGVYPVANKAMTALMGDLGGKLLSAMIALSIIGAVNAMLFIGPRVLYAMARDNMFFAFAKDVDPNTNVPRKSVLALALISCVMVLVGTLRELLDVAGFILILFSFLAVMAVFVLRVRQPNLERPYKAWGYPITPGLFCAFSVYLLISSLKFHYGQGKIWLMISGIVLVLAGIPLFYVYRAIKSKGQSG